MPNVGIIDFIIHPPLGSLTARLDTNGPYGPGNHTLDEWNDSGSTFLVGSTYGVIARATGPIPPDLGLTLGWDGGGGPAFDGTEFQQRLIQIVAQHQLLLGPLVNTQIDDQFVLAEVHLWREAVPGRLGLYVSPGLSFDLFFLVFL